jgi:Response regulators consisting of a CheY-like receiver domain and a winged-helix DNA-binding domain
MIPEQTRPTRESRRILIVEDDADLREALSEVLRDEGYAVTSAADGQEALDRLRRELRPSLILLDLTMPVMNGWQFRAEQRQDPDLSEIPVVVLSAGEHLAEQMQPLEIEDFVRKPIELGHLLQKIERYCA